MGETAREVSGKKQRNVDRVNDTKGKYESIYIHMYRDVYMCVCMCVFRLVGIAF